MQCHCIFVVLLNRNISILSKVYPNELEAQPEFEGFSEWLETFDLYRGKAEEETEDQNRSQCTGQNRSPERQCHANGVWTFIAMTINDDVIVLALKADNY